MSPPVGLRTFKPTWCVIRERRDPEPVDVSSSHPTGNSNLSMMGEVFPPMLSLPATLLLYAIMTFSGNSSLVHASPVAQPHGCATKPGDIIHSNFVHPVEHLPAGSSHRIPEHHCFTPTPDSNASFCWLRETRNPYYWGIGPEHAQHWFQFSQCAQPVQVSPLLHCQPYATTPISAFTPFLQHTASSWVNAFFSPNTVLCALDNLFPHLLPCPPPTI